MRKMYIGIGAAALAAVTATGGVALAQGHTPAAMVSAATGHDHHDDVTPSATPTAITADQARKAALAAVPGSRITSTELETEHGVRVWEVKLVTGSGVRHEVKVDARTGRVLTDDRRDDRRHDRTDDRTGDRGHDAGDDHPAAAGHEAGDDHPGARTGRDDHGGRSGRGGHDDGPGHDAGDDHGRHGG